MRASRNFKKKCNNSREKNDGGDKTLLPVTQKHTGILRFRRHLALRRNTTLYPPRKQLVSLGIAFKNSGMASLSSKSPLPTETDWSEAVRQAVQRLKEININFLAIDFDQTILDIHTGGAWKGSAVELSEHVRPLFRDLIDAALSADIHVAVVTYTPQVAFVAEVLDRTFGERAREIPIRGNDCSWSYNGQGSKSGKQPHMASAVEELGSKFTTDITKQTTVLIDDDAKNIRVCLKDGVRAIWLNPEKPNRLLNHISRLI